MWPISQGAGWRVHPPGQRGRLAQAVTKRRGLPRVRGVCEDPTACAWWPAARA